MTTPADMVSNGFQRALQDASILHGLIQKARDADDAEQMEEALLDALGQLDQLGAGLRRIIHHIV